MVSIENTESPRITEFINKVFEFGREISSHRLLKGYILREKISLSDESEVNLLIWVETSSMTLILEEFQV